MHTLYVLLFLYAKHYCVLNFNPLNSFFSFIFFALVPLTVLLIDVSSLDHIRSISTACCCIQGKVCHVNDNNNPFTAKMSVLPSCNILGRDQTFNVKTYNFL